MHGNTASREYGREPKISVLRSEGTTRGGRRGCKMESRMCRFVRDGEPDIGEYRELADGTGICVLADMNGDSEEVVVSLPDGTMPENNSDLELLKVPTTMHGPESGPLTPAEVAERMARTDFIIEEYKTGILDEHEAGAELFHHLFPNEH